ncbi:hypothetical protein BVRB_7g180320 [Beta vulgaris subsp. vulgaris]|uniref:Small ribosomal subunit protein uS8c n=1 Tax=Beta vulgaris subsp. vulgaris TaxID=3555 RepID=A0A0J8E1G4_BETVV|nr:hypothetical protein BVRB_7g180320 [Beta vulgaris subsp. vulgaris]
MGYESLSSCLGGEMVDTRGGIGIAILSTLRGIMTDWEPQLEGIGGGILCYIW